MDLAIFKLCKAVNATECADLETSQVGVFGLEEEAPGGEALSRKCLGLKDSAYGGTYGGTVFCDANCNIQTMRLNIIEQLGTCHEKRCLHSFR